MLLKDSLNSIYPFSSSDWQVAKSYFKKESYSQDSYFVREGQYTDKIAFIEKGLFRLFYRVRGSERIMLFFHENQFMTDYFGYLTESPSIRPIQALEDSIVYTISKENLNKLFTFSQNWEHIGRLMAEQAYVTSVQRANRLLHDNYDTRFNTMVKEMPTILQRVPQYMIASYLNMTPETLSRVKKRLMGAEEIKESVHKSV